MPAEESKAALQRAIEELARQRSEIEALRSEKREPIAVVGMACRLPGAETPEEFWELLDQGTDSVSEVPRERWNVDAYYDGDPSTVGKMATRCGGFIRNVDQFDPQFFGMAPREAQNMDPQQRVLLEVAWEALEHANIPPSSLYGSLTGVFVGITCFDHAIRMSRSTEGFNAYAGTGSALNMAPGRVSYVLGLIGPSMAIDTACSSSLVCLHVACQSLRQRESNVALVGGVHLILSPEVMVSFSQARMLSADGRSKTFDASADGYSRGEGCGVVVLKRVADALADGDTILGVIRGSAVNQDGPSGGLTVPNGGSQQQVIRRALDAAGVSPSAVTYVEAHGTGTSLGDPIEVEALAKAYGAGRAPDDSLLIGSVKTNIGHLEPAAGMAGLIKLLLAFEHGRIPQQLHFRTPNPHIAWHDVPVRVVSEPVPWPRTDRARLAGLSAFGFSGTNAHVIVEEPPTSDVSATVVSRRPQLLPLSAKSPEALKALASRYVALLTQEPGIDLGALCRTASVGRTHFAQRLVALVGTIDEAKKALGAFVADRSSPALRIGKASNAAYRRDASDVQARLSRAYDSLMRPDASVTERADLLGEIADLHMEGMPIEWDRLCGPDRPSRVTLPTYPFQRQRYWIDTPDQTGDRVESESCSPWLYHIVWTSLGPPATPAVSSADRRWVLVPGDGPLADATCHQLRESGSEAQVTPATEAADLAATDVVYVCGAQGPDGSTGACAELLTIVRALLDRHDASPRIWVVTRGATPAAGATSIVGVSHAPLAAFARVLSLEHPELFGRLVDLDPAIEQNDSGDAAALITEILQEGEEDQVALRGGERFAPRVDAVPDRVRAAAPVHADATYLITGGLGRLGLHVATWLADRGARHLCLLGRTGVSTSEQRAAVSALEARGLCVRVAQGDVADRTTMAALIRDLGEAPALRGVVHAAGLPGYAEIAQLTHDDLASVLRPKTEGAWALHELTRDIPLDFFVCFSSIASAWGSRGQAHYAAANAFLDSLTHLRRASGLPAVTINWGPWTDGGMTSPEATALLARVGVRALASGDALAALDALAAGDEPQVVVADVDWGLFRGSYEARGHRRLLERLQPAVDEPTAAVESALVRSLKAATSADREALLGAAVQAELADVLALPERSRPPLDQGLFEMGMDSLMALEFRTRLQTLVARALPATLVFDCPTIHAIVRFLLAELFAPPEGGTKTRVGHEPTPAVAAEPAADLEELSENEAEALLLKKLEFIP